jgi:hypothetical protein
MEPSANNPLSEDQAAAEPEQEHVVIPSPHNPHESTPAAQGNPASRANVPPDGWSLDANISVSLQRWFSSLSNGLCRLTQLRMLILLSEGSLKCAIKYFRPRIEKSR